MYDNFFCCSDAIEIVGRETVPREGGFGQPGNDEGASEEANRGAARQVRLVYSLVGECFAVHRTFIVITLPPSL